MRLVDLVDLARYVAGNQRDLADRRGIVIDLELPDHPVELETNSSMLEKIAANLVSNAVRYSRDEGKVTIKVADDDNWVRLEVADEGIGIAPEDRERIFEEFFRSQQAQQVTALGTGLGLSIVRKFVERLGGAIDLWSEPGKGSRFTVVLPRKAGTTEVKGK
jgi:signal transduction histidine kinase